MTQKIVNLTDAARHVGKPKRTFYRYLEDGRCPVRPVKGLRPRQWRIADLDAWIDGTYDASVDA